MAMSAKELIIPVDIQLKMEDFGPRAGVELVKTEFGKLTKVTDRATNMMNQFNETVNHINTKGIDRVTKKLYDTQKVGVEAAQEILSAYSRIDAIMSEVIKGKELIPAGKSLDDLRAERKAIEDNLTALMQEEKYLERELPNALEKTKKEIASVIGQLGVLGRERKKGFMPLAQFVENQNDVARLKERLTELRAEYAKLTATQETSSATLAKNRETIAQLEEKLLELKNILAANKGLTSEEELTISRNLRSMARGFANLNEQELRVGIIKNSYKDANKEATNFHTNSMRYARKHNSVLKTMANLVKKVSHYFKDVLKNTRKSFDSSQNGMKQALRNIMRYGLGVRSLYFLFRRLRTAAKDAFGVMAQQWEPVNRQISSMIQSLNGVKGSIATMLQPLLEGFSKIFVQFMNGLQKVMETIGAFFAFLTGQNYILRAKAGGVDWADHLADKLGQAKDEAEELNKQLAGFDKINNLTTKDNKDKDNDKSSIGLDTVTFEKVPIEQLDIFNWLKDMWLKSDFGDLGRFLNEKLLGILQKIDWDEIERLGRKIGTCIATAVNGFFENDALAYEIGEAIAGWLNAKFATLYEFASRVEWDRIGVFIVTGIRSFFENAKFGEWGSAAGALLSGLLEALYVVVTDESNWKLLGQKIIDGINGFIETMLTKKRVFKGFGMNHIPIYEELNGFQMAGGALSGFATNFIETLTSILDDRQLWQNFGQGVGDFISAIDWSQVIIDLSGLVLALLKALTTVQKSLIETLEKSDNPIAKSIGMGLDVTLNGDVGKRIAKKFIAGFMQGVEESGIDKDDNRVLSVFAGIISGIKRIFKIQSPSKVMISIAQDVIAGFLNPFNTLSQRFSAIWENVKNGAVSALNTMRNSLASVASSIVGVMNSLSSSVSSMISNILNSFNRLSGIEVNLSGVSSGAILGTKVKIPHLAKGAVIPPNNQFLAMLGDQKSGTNIEAPISTIEDALRNVLNTIELNVAFDVQGDPEHIFNVVRRQSNQFTKRTGLSF